MQLRRLSSILAASSAASWALVPAPALAGDVTHIVSGTWQSSDFHDPANPGCSVGSNASVAGGRLIMGASQRTASPMSLVIRKAGWAIPKGMAVHVSASFPDGQSMDLPGTGDGQAIAINMPPAKLPPWVHELTASSLMRLTFAGTEPPWTFDLSGTTAVITAMPRCFVDHGITGADAPFAPASGNSLPAATQPFGGTAQAASPTSLQPSTAAPSFPSGPTPVPTSASTAAPGAVGSNGEPADAARQAVAPQDTPQPAPTLGSAAAACTDDWHRCGDNADLVNHWKSYLDVQTKCQDAASHEAKYGDPKWPGFWSGGSFGRFKSGADYVSSGVAIAIEPDVQFQNQFGAMVHSTAVCRFNLNSMAVEGVTVEPN